MMITAVYFQARPGVVFSDLLLLAHGPRPGAVSYVTFGAAAPLANPCRCGPNLTGQTDRPNTPSRLLGLSDAHLEPRQFVEVACCLNDQMYCSHIWRVKIFEWILQLRRMTEEPLNKKNSKINTTAYLQ